MYSPPAIMGLIKLFTPPPPQLVMHYTLNVMTGSIRVIQWSPPSTSQASRGEAPYDVFHIIMATIIRNLKLYSVHYLDNLLHARRE